MSATASIERLRADAERTASQFSASARALAAVDTKLVAVRTVLNPNRFGDGRGPRPTEEQLVQARQDRPLLEAEQGRLILANRQDARARDAASQALLEALRADHAERLRPLIAAAEKVLAATQKAMGAIYAEQVRYGSDAGVQVGDPLYVPELIAGTDFDTAARWRERVRSAGITS